MLAARENLQAALADTGQPAAAERLAEAARDAVARIDEVIDALFAASTDQDAPDGAPWSQLTVGQGDGGPAHAVR